MGTATIELPVDEETARAYRAISDEEKERIIGVVSGWVKQSAAADGRSLVEVMHDLGREAVANGMTENVLKDLLREP